MGSAGPALLQYMRDSDAVGAVIAGAYVRPAEELVTALRKGSYLRKYGRRGKPKNHYFRLSADDKELLWDSSNGKVRSIPLVSVVKVQQGQTTEVFSRDPMPEYEAMSFSLIYTEGRMGKKRSLDVICRNMAEFETWFWGIQLVIAWTQNVAMQQQLQQQLASQQSVAITSPAAAGLRSQLSLQSKSMPSSPRRSADRLEEFKQIAAALQPSTAATGAAVLSPQPVQQRVAGSGVLGAPPPAKREIGDCYIWGDWADAEAFAAVAAGDCTLQSCCVPIMVTNTHALDVIQVAIGARHAALLTRGGEVYSWGSGLGGKLGNGTNNGTMYPTQVMRLAGKGTLAVACGHSYTAAILPDGSLYTWGTGLGGQLGQGPAVLGVVWPMRVTALSGIRVDQISCGPFHAAAVSDDGRLFTWGDGMFGKLGHGDHETCSSPRQVTALAEHWVVSVSCGWWHSAAAAAPRSALYQDGSAHSVSSTGGGSVDTSLSRQQSAGKHAPFVRPTVHAAASSSNWSASRASSYSSFAGLSRGASGVLGDIGGGLFTWGGDFTWQYKGKRDHHDGCLGLGDLAGRLVPTMVKGEDDIKQVACGLNFTVALTRNGEVLQMGRTGAENNREHNAMWEGARVPVLVSGLLSSHFAESLACGMSHVAVVATQRKANGSMGGSANATRLLTWGQGSRGQLGLGDSREDHLLPQVVTAVAGRRMLYLACGGHYTIAVCEHDPHTTRWSRDTLDIDIGISAAVSAAASLITGSGPSRMHLQNAGSAASGSLAGPASDKTGSAGALGPRGPTPVASGLVLSASYNSLASSAPSSSRGEGGSGGGIGVSSSRAVRSERRLDTHFSDKGFAGHGSSKGNVLTRSVDLSWPGGSGTGNRGGLVTQSLSLALGGGERGVTFSPTSVMGGSKSSERGGAGFGNHSGAADPSMMSLQSLAKATKKSRLAIAKSFKGSGYKSSSNADMPSNLDGSNASNTSSRHGWGDSSLHKQQQRQGQQQGTPLSSRSNMRQVSYSSNYSVRSEQDLMTISTNSSISSMTPSPSMHSIPDSRGYNGEGVASPAASMADDMVKQLRYWQERAANMEQQLSRKTHELEQLQRSLRHTSSSSSKQLTQRQDSRQQHQQQQEAGATSEPASPASTPPTGSSNVTEAEPAAAAASAEAKASASVEAGDAASAGQQLRAEQQGLAPAVSSTAAGAGGAGTAAAHVETTVQQQDAHASAFAATSADAASADDGTAASQKSDDSAGILRGTSLVSWMKGSKTGSSSNSSIAGGTATSQAAADTTAAGAAQLQQQKQQQEQQQQQPPGLPVPKKSRSLSTGDAFSFHQSSSSSSTMHPDKQRHLQPQQPTEQQQRSLHRGISLPTGNHVHQLQQQHSMQQQRSGLGVGAGSTSIRRKETTSVILEHEAFAEMGTHSREASRVLALFQESQQRRQEQEQQHQVNVQPEVHQLPAAPAAVRAGAAAAADSDSESYTSAGNSPHGAGYHSAFSGVPISPSHGSGSSRSSLSKRLPQILQQNAGTSSSGAAIATAAAVQPSVGAGTTGAEAELERLREQNRLLQQQLAELRDHPQQQRQVVQQPAQQPQQQQLPALPLGQAGLPLLRTGSSALSNGDSMVSHGSSWGGAPSSGVSSHLTLQGMRHRRAVSVDIGVAQEVVTHEVSPGVYLSMQALPSGGHELKRVRFAKQMFSSEDAEHWWAANRHAVYASYNIVSQQPSHPHQPQVAVAGFCSPNAGSPEQQQQQLLHVTSSSGRMKASAAAAAAMAAVLGPANGGGSPPVVSVANPHPLGQPAAITSRTGSLSDVRTKRVSTGDWTPSASSPHYSSPGTGSTTSYDLDPASAAAGSSARPSDTNMSRLGRPQSVTAVAAHDSSSEAAGSPKRHSSNHSRAGSVGALSFLTDSVQLLRADTSRQSNGGIVEQLQWQPLLQQQLSSRDSVDGDMGTPVLGAGRYSQLAEGSVSSSVGSGVGANASSGTGSGGHRRTTSAGIFRLFSKNGGASGAVDGGASL